MPDFLRALSLANPIFYVIDGVRRGVLGVSDAPPCLGLLVVTVSAAVVGALA